MDDSALNTVRLESTSRELRALRASIEAWLSDWAASDVDAGGKYRGKYRSQLAALRGLLLGAAEAIEGSLADLRDRFGEPAGEFYGWCRECDAGIVWVHRLWESFRQKIAQRTIGSETRALLLAADEVLWSCYAAPMRMAGVQNPRAPLSFVEPEYSPAAIQEGRTMPVQLRLDAGDEELRAFARSLPVSMVRLPAACVRSPWWLVFVAHEVGHLLQNDLGRTATNDLNLFEHTRAGIKLAALAGGTDETDAESWARWGEEIFADFVSILLVGPWALLALCEVERGTHAEMCARRRSYPSPIVRLSLLKLALQRVGGLKVQDASAMRGIDTAAVTSGSPEAAADLAVVPHVVDFLMKPLPNGKTLMKLCSAEPSPNGSWPGGRVAAWRDHLLGRKKIPIEQTAQAARLVVCGSQAAWEEVASTAALDEHARDSLRDALAERSLTTLAASSEPGLRAAGDAEDAERRARSQGGAMARSVLTRLRSHEAPSAATRGDR